MSSSDRRLFDGDRKLKSLSYSCEVVSCFIANAMAENKTEQLMGSFLASNGDYFMVNKLSCDQTVKFWLHYESTSAVCM